MDIEAIIHYKQEQRRALKCRYNHAAERRREVRHRMVLPGKEGIKRKILARYDLECKTLIDQINDLGEEIYKLQRNGVESE